MGPLRVRDAHAFGPPTISPKHRTEPTASNGAAQAREFNEGESPMFNALIRGIPLGSDHTPALPPKEPAYSPTQWED